jgi:hypothetical protein
MSETYHAFYVGMERGLEHRSFDGETALLAFVKKALDDSYYHRGLTVVYGELIEFEPATFVESYRIKDSE